MRDDVAADMVEEFLPPVPRTLETCYALRDVGYRPYALMNIMGRELEVISMPFPQDRPRSGCGIGLMVREPGDPTTMFEWDVPASVARKAIRLSAGGWRAR